MHTLIFSAKLYNKLNNVKFNLSFSQCGEDSILHFLIKALKLDNIQYFDFGTNDPCNMNNTYLLYLNGYRGICVEPDPFFHKKISKYRPKDVLIKSGISTSNYTSADFYIMDDSVLNTFSKEEADKMVNIHNRNIIKTIQVSCISVNDIFEKYYNREVHNILSLDIEGLDFEILKSIDYERYKPCIICTETLEFSENLSGKKNYDIINFLIQKGYTLYADTHINSIFVCNSLL